MRSKHIILALLFLLLGIGSSLSSTAQFNDQVIEEVNGKRYYVHKVEKGHSLYAIAKLYNSDVTTIVKANPDAAEGLKIGQSLRIPIETENTEGLWENPIRIEGGHLIHRVKRRETLYSISKEYNVDMNDILELNPKANAGLKLGMELRITVNDIEATFLPERQAENQPHLKYHDVEMKETVYSISRKYGVTVDELIQANGGLPDGLKSGSRIVIPQVPIENMSQRAGMDDPVSIKGNYKLDLKGDKVYKQSYKIALLLPFYIGYEDSAYFSVSKQRLQQIAMEFYRGVSMSIDSLREQGLSAELVVQDMHSATPNRQAILRDLKSGGVDLIIGPLQRSVFEEVAKYFSDSNTHIVCPVKQNNKVLLLHENLSKVIPSNVSQMDALASYVSSAYQGANFLFVNSTFAKDVRNVQLFRSAFNGYTSRADSVSLLQELTVEKNKTISGLELRLSPDKKNVIIAPTSNEVVVADLMRRLVQLKDGFYDIEVIGLDRWRSFYETVNMEAREKYHIHMPSAQFEDELSWKKKSFNRAYRKKYNVDAGKYAVLGYDIGRYYGLGILTYGINFPNHFADIDQSPLVQNQFNFAKTGVEAGYENTHVYILAYEKYQLQKVTH